MILEPLIKGDQNMENILIKALNRTVKDVAEELALMPLQQWYESVFRYFFCRSIAANNPKIEQNLECNRIDLVLRYAGETAFVEFKFYGHPKRVDPYSGKVRGVKGGPGPKNLSEFEDCVRNLHARRSIQGLEKYIVLAFWDPKSKEQEGKAKYFESYNDYQYPKMDVPLRLLKQSRDLDANGLRFKVQLYMVG